MKNKIEMGRTRVVNHEDRIYYSKDDNFSYSFERKSERMIFRYNFRGRNGRFEHKGMCDLKAFLEFADFAEEFFWRHDCRSKHYDIFFTISHKCEYYMSEGDFFVQFEGGKHFSSLKFTNKKNHHQRFWVDAN